jgi:ketosteroid isomerase-like protein
MTLPAVARPDVATARRPRVHAWSRLAAFLLLCPLLGAPDVRSAPRGTRVTTAAAAATAAARDEALIRAALVDHVARYNARDWQAMRLEYSEDALVMPSYVATAEGRDHVNDLYRGEFASAQDSESNSVMEAHMDEVQVHGDWAFDRGTITVVTSQGGYERKMAVRFMNIRRRLPDGKWTIIRSMDNPITPPFGSSSKR